MKRIYLVIPLGLVVGLLVAMSVNRPVWAQTPPDDLTYPLPIVSLHGSAINAHSGGHETIPITIDVNGDGLVDLVMSENNKQTGAWQQYVYLNNGNGWDQVYECNKADFSSPWTGDCDWLN